MNQPKWINQLLKDQDFIVIEEAIKKAELKTSGEVVPVIVRSSIQTGHVPIILTLSFSLIYLFFDLYHFQINNLELNFWFVQISNLILGVAIIFLSSSFSIVKRLLTTKEDILNQVKQRAINEFYNQRVDKTKKSTGILIYLSLLERRAIVLGDQAISQKITQEDWQSVVDLLIQGIKKKELSRGLIKAIEKSGDLLATHFPIRGNDQNELPNKLIILE